MYKYNKFKYLSLPFQNFIKGLREDQFLFPEENRVLENILKEFGDKIWVDLTVYHFEVLPLPGQVPKNVFFGCYYAKQKNYIEAAKYGNLAAFATLEALITSALENDEVETALAHCKGLRIYGTPGHMLFVTAYLKVLDSLMRQLEQLGKANFSASVFPQPSSATSPTPPDAFLNTEQRSELKKDLRERIRDNAKLTLQHAYLASLKYQDSQLILQNIGWDKKISSMYGSIESFTKEIEQYIKDILRPEAIAEVKSEAELMVNSQRGQPISNTENLKPVAAVSTQPSL